MVFMLCLCVMEVEMLIDIVVLKYGLVVGDVGCFENVDWIIL